MKHLLNAIAVICLLIALIGGAVVWVFVETSYQASAEQAAPVTAEQATSQLAHAVARTNDEPQIVYVYRHIVNPVRLIVVRTCGYTASARTLVPTATYIPPTIEETKTLVPTATYVPPTIEETKTPIVIKTLVPTATYVPPTIEATKTPVVIKTPVPDVTATLGNPGNNKPKGKAGEKDGKGFCAPSEGGKGTKGRSEHGKCK